MNRIPQSQLQTLELLTQFGRLSKKKLDLFPKRDIRGLEKRHYLLPVPVSKNLFFISERGIRILNKYNSDPLKRELEVTYSNGYHMAKVIIRCPHCKKIAEITKQSAAFGSVFKTFSCGHTISEKEIKIPAGRDEMWFKARPYQQQGIEFIEKSGINALLGDGMGLGKTVQVALTLRYHWDDLTPALCIVKSALKYQWAAHYMEWSVSHNGEFPLEKLPYIITDGKMPVLPGFKFYIIGMDLLKKKWEELKELGIKLLIVDECHHFKNETSSRTASLVKLVKETNIPYKLFTSGTPILNRSTEFFTTLNILRPTEWPSRISFYRNWCSTNEKGQYDKIASWEMDRFKNRIAPYFLRREKREVLKDLPPFQRNFRIVEIENEELKKSYNKELDLMRNFMHNADKVDAMSLLGYLTKLRRITGLAKIPVCVEDTLDFLEYADEETGDKIAIGVHHKAVMQSLKLAFEARGYDVVTISGEDSAEEKLEKERQFKLPGKHILLASILAAGEGLNLQYCSMATVLERQWNAAKEEQYEGRFDRFGQTRPTSCDYFIAKGTVDEYFTDMVEKKRKDCGDALGDTLNVESNLNALMELAEKTVANRL